MELEQLLAPCSSAFDQLIYSRTLTLGEAARLTATFKGIEVLHDLVPPDPHTLQLVISLRNLLEDVHALLSRYRPIMVASVKMADVPQLQEAIKQRYGSVLDDKLPGPSVKASN